MQGHAVRPLAGNAYNLDRYEAPSESVTIMKEGIPESTFRGLPLTSEQDSEIRHYILTRERKGEQWDTPELEAMLADMLNPPEVVDDDVQARDDSMAAERTTAESEESLDTDEPPSQRTR